jgi:hypothetical protein
MKQVIATTSEQVVAKVAFFKPRNQECRIPLLSPRSGRCYELSFKGALRSKVWCVVHGEVNGPPDIGRIGHAWLEYGEAVYNPTDDTFYQSWEFRMRLQATPIAFYTVQEACAKAAEFEHYGPWH